MKMNKLVSLRPNYFIFIGYLKTGNGGGGSSEPRDPLLDPPLTYANLHMYCLYISLDSFVKLIVN